MRLVRESNMKAEEKNKTFLIYYINALYVTINPDICNIASYDKNQNANGHIHFLYFDIIKKIRHTSYN